MCFDCTDLKVGSTKVWSKADVLVFDGHADLGVDADLDDYHHVMIWRREELGDFCVSLTFLLPPPHPDLGHPIKTIESDKNYYI